MGRPKEHDAETATALLEAAERAIEERGVDALSVRGVAGEVGVSTRAVYSVYGSKEGLVAELAVRAFDRLGAAVRDLPTTEDPTADLVGAALEFRRFAIGHPSLFAIGIQRALRLSEAAWARVRAASRRALGELELRITRLQSAGLLGDRTVGVATFQFHAYCEGMTALELRGQLGLESEVFEQMWVSGMSALLNGFRVT
jgi:AcrR family transcriptional regulator